MEDVMRIVVAMALVLLVAAPVTGSAAAQTQKQTRAASTTLTPESCVRMCKHRVGEAHRNSYSWCMSRCSVTISEQNKRASQAKR